MRGPVALGSQPRESLWALLGRGAAECFLRWALVREHHGQGLGGSMTAVGRELRGGREMGREPQRV